MTTLQALENCPGDRLSDLIRGNFEAIVHLEGMGIGAGGPR